jgi:hypothetical protein
LRRTDARDAVDRQREGHVSRRRPQHGSGGRHRCRYGTGYHDRGECEQKPDGKSEHNRYHAHAALADCIEACRQLRGRNADTREPREPGPQRPSSQDQPERSQSQDHRTQREDGIARAAGEAKHGCGTQQDGHDRRQIEQSRQQQHAGRMQQAVAVVAAHEHRIAEFAQTERQNEIQEVEL